MSPLWLLFCCCLALLVFPGPSLAAEGQCTYHKRGGLLHMKHYVCCDNCGENDGAPDCGQTTYLADSTERDYCGSCGEDRGDARETVGTFSCGGCTGQAQVKAGAAAVGRIGETRGRRWERSAVAAVRDRHKSGLGATRGMCTQARRSAGCTVNVSSCGVRKSRRTPYRDPARQTSLTAETAIATSILRTPRAARLTAARCGTLTSADIRTTAASVRLSAAPSQGAVWTKD
ncbi:uncharacterized protein LOC144925342 [Branchiostoma floridae x Branchiostoma belcheri]